MRRRFSRGRGVRRLSLPAALVLAACGTTTSAPSDAGPADAASDAPAAPPLRVLFVGNSYTYVNDLPSVVHALGEATAGAAVEVDSVTEGGATLQSLWAEGIAPARIAAGDLDAVVLQGNSLEAVGLATWFYPSAAQFADAVRAAGARPVWYATWARRPGDAYYATYGSTPALMTRSIDHSYRTAASTSGGTVARVGTAWQLALAELPDVELYAADGSHPSPAGTLLAACTMFLALTGREAVLPDPAPLGVDHATAVRLCALAPRVACPPSGCACAHAAQMASTYAQLSALAPACDGTTERRGLDCGVAAAAACAATACVTSGFGVQSFTATGAVDLTCVAGTDLHTTFTALSALVPACDGTTERFGPDCATAIDLACAATGALSGFGPTAASGDDLTATCVPPADAMRQHVDFTRLRAFDATCDGFAQRAGADCDYAVTSFCRAQGFAGGFGPTASAGTTADVVCVDW